MSAEDSMRVESSGDLPNGPGAAATLAAGAGAFLLAVLAILADKVATIKAMMSFYRPTGPLSGVTTTAIVLWLLIWLVLELLWRKKDVRSGRIHLLAFILLGLGLALTFPPLADLF